MQLREYLDTEGRTIKWLAKKAGMTQQTISFYLCHNKKNGAIMSKKNALAIHAATEGKVKAWEIIFPEFELEEVKQKRKYTKKKDCEESSNEISQINT